MKKIMMLLLVAFLMLGMSGKAMAYFGNDELFRVVYNANNGTGNEFFTDLGTFNNLTDPTQLSGTMNLNTSNFNEGTYAGPTSQVAYFMYDGTHVWVSGDANGGYSGGHALSKFLTPYNNMNSVVAAVGTQSVTLAQSNGDSYYTQANGGGTTAGTMGGFLSLLNSHTGMNANLPGGVVDQFLYYFGTPNATGAQTAVAVAQIITNADGSTTLEQIGAPVPIPAAVYLFGSSLLGLVGLRRKMSV